jgi:DNA repair exonuclease SbcCD ATPase subunit
MRRIVFLILGVLELLSAALLAHFAWQVPGRREVEETRSRAERVTQHTGAQVQRLRDQVRLLRERRPQMRTLALRLQSEMRLVNDELKTQKVDYATVKTLSDSLGDAASGLDGLADTMDPKGMDQFSQGLKATADFLDKQVAPAAGKAADDLDKATESLRGDAKRLSALLRTAPPDLKAAREIHDSLSKFDQGLERMTDLLKVERIQTMREGFKGLEQSLNTGAEQVERLSGYTYPVVTFHGFKPGVEQRGFWPEGDKIADGMRKAAKGTTAATEELDLLVKDLPKLRQSLEESRKAAGATRAALATALKQQDQVEALLKDVPEKAARLSEQLPQLAADLATILRDTSRLKAIAQLLRQTQQGIDKAIERWPELRKNLGRSAVLLRNAQEQLQHVLTHRNEYEASLQHTLGLSRTFSAALPLLTEQLEMELDDQERALTSLDDSINDVREALPACADSATSILQTTRLLLVLMAAIFGLHGSYLVLGTRLGRRFSH